MIRQTYYDIVSKRIDEPRRFIQVISGPRQVGKFTLIGQVLEKVQIPYTFAVADAVPSADTEWIAEIWETSRAKMDFRHEKEHLLVIDEIQKLLGWSEVVKREWDRDTREERNLKVVLLGSS